MTGRVDVTERPTDSGERGVPWSATLARGAEPGHHGRRIIVSPDGDDSHAGTESAPIRSLAEAQRRLRDLPGGTVVLTDGVWHLDQPIRLTGRDSGRPGAPRRWVAAAGARAVISGGVPVRGWVLRDSERRIFRAAVPGIARTRQVSIDGRLGERSSMSIDRSQVTITEEGLSFRDPSLARLAELTRHDRIEIACVASFTHRYAPVARIERDRIVMQQPAWQNNTWGWDTVADPVEGGRLQLVNAEELLQPGQWYFDEQEGALLFRAAEGDHPERHRFVVPRLDSLLEIAGDLDEPVHDVQIRGLEFAHTSWLAPSGPAGYASQQAGTFLGREFPQPPDRMLTCQRSCPEFEATRNHWDQMPAAVQVSAATRIDLVGNSFTLLGQVALGIGNDAPAHSAGVGLSTRDVLVQHNRFAELSGGAIVVGGVRPEAHHPVDPRLVVGDIVIDNNLVIRAAIDYMDMAGILSTYVERAVITHNEVCELPYDGIDIGFGWGANDPGGSPEYRTRGLYAAQPVYTAPTTLRETHVTRNLVHGTKREFTDGGAIYNLSANPGAVVTDNYLRDNNRSVGLYLDEGSRFVTLERNVVQDAPVWVFTNTYGENNTSDNLITRNWYNGGRTHMPDPEAHGNLLLDNVLVAGRDWPLEAQRVISRAGLEPAFRTFPEATAPAPFGAVLRLAPSGAGPRLTLVVENFGDQPLRRITVDRLGPPPGVSLRRRRPLPSEAGPGSRVTGCWDVVPVPAMTGELRLSVSGVVDGVHHHVDVSTVLAPGD